MARKHIATLAALLSFANAVHADGFDSMNQPQAVMFYYAFPIDARSKKERTPWMGMQIQGRNYQAYNVDTRMLTLAEEGGAASASLILIGVAAVGAAALVTHRGKNSQEQVSQEKQQVQQQQAQQPPAPCTC
jgi:hypothetical protein